MNPRIILHLFKTTWLRLWWLVVIGWLLMLAAAWPALAFQFMLSESEGDIRWIADYGIAPDAPGWGMFVPVLLAIGMNILTATIALQGRGWSGTRPVRPGEVVMSRMIALLLFQALPLIGLSMVNMSIHGFSLPVTLRNGMLAALVLIPRLASIAFFARVCGTFWRWCAGMLSFLAATFLGGALLPFLLPLVAFVTDPFGANTFPASIGVLWAGMLSLAVFAALCRDRWGARLRISITLAVWLIGASTVILVVPPRSLG